jgi:hypothetical protein
VSIYQDYAAPHSSEVFDKWATGRSRPSVAMDPRPCMMCRTLFKPTREGHYNCGSHDCVKAYQRARRAGTLPSVEQREANVTKHQQSAKQEADAKSHEAYKQWVAELTQRLGRKPTFFDMMEDRKRIRREAGLEDDDDDITEFAYR